MMELLTTLECVRFQQSISFIYATFFVFHGIFNSIQKPSIGIYLMCHGSSFYSQIYEQYYQFNGYHQTGFMQTQKDVCYVFEINPPCHNWNQQPDCCQDFLNYTFQSCDSSQSSCQNGECVDCQFKAYDYWVINFAPIRFICYSSLFLQAYQFSNSLYRLFQLQNLMIIITHFAHLIILHDAYHICKAISNLIQLQTSLRLKLANLMNIVGSISRILRKASVRSLLKHTNWSPAINKSNWSFATSKKNLDPSWGHQNQESLGRFDDNQSQSQQQLGIQPSTKKAASNLPKQSQLKLRSQNLLRLNEQQPSLLYSQNIQHKQRSKQQNYVVLHNYLIPTPPQKFYSLSAFLLYMEKQLDSQSSFLFSFTIDPLLNSKSNWLSNANKLSIQQEKQNLKKSMRMIKQMHKNRDKLSRKEKDVYQLRYYKQMMNSYNANVSKVQDKYYRLYRKLIGKLPQYYSMILTYTQLSQQVIQNYGLSKLKKQAENNKQLEKNLDKLKSQLCDSQFKLQLSNKQIFEKLYRAHPLIKYLLYKLYKKIHQQSNKTTQFSNKVYNIPILFFRHPYQLHILDQCLKNNVRLNLDYVDMHGVDFDQTEHYEQIAGSTKNQSTPITNLSKEQYYLPIKQIVAFDQKYQKLQQQLKENYSKRTMEYLTVYERQMNRILFSTGLTIQKLNKLINNQFCAANQLLIRKIMGA